MLYFVIFLYYMKWVSLFENFKYIVIDEFYMYCGVFGSYVVNVIWWLKWICWFYGSDLVFICIFVIIVNLKELGEQLMGKLMWLVEDNGVLSG